MTDSKGDTGMATIKPPPDVRGHYCGDCGSVNIRRTLGPCSLCDEPLDGEPSPASRTEGLFHRYCWNEIVGTQPRPRPGGMYDLARAREAL